MGSALQARLKRKEASNALLKGLHKGQLEVENDPARFKLLRCGRKWRKTSYQINWLIRMALKTGLTCPYVAPNRVQAENIAWRDHVQRELDVLTSVGKKFKTNEQKLTVTFENGGRIQLMGVENKEALRGISNWGGISCDEMDDWDEDIWPTIIRPNLMTYRAPAVIAGTPKGERYLFSLENAKKNVTIKGKKSREHIFKTFHFTSYDNPALDRAELDDMVEEYKEKGQDYFLQEVMAEYIAPVGLVYKEWNMANFRKISYDPLLPLHISFDWGVNDPTSIVWIQVGHGEYRVIDYFESSDTAIEEIAAIIKSKPYKAAEMYCGDPAGKARSIVTNTSPVEELAKKGF